ncbi:MAG: molybdenum cofactor guanylyltransferase [Anaerolineae bacterium]|nr:molybdenum cofactor guanylyltransferase [Anaerolineae bacterium]
MDPHTSSPLSVLILAGGRSRRMGRDKIWMELDGIPLIERLVRRVLPLAAEILFSTNAAERFAAYGATLPVPTRIVADRFPDAGPLAGLHAGLYAARHELLLALAADLPFVNPDLIRHLIGLTEGFDAVVPQTADATTGTLQWEPLHALYRRTCLPAIEAHLAAGQRPVICFFDAVRVRAVPPEELRRFDPDLLSFFNINTPADWARGREVARRLAEHRGDQARAAT